MVLSIYDGTICDVGQEICEYDSSEKAVDAIVFAIEKARNEHPTDFQALVECLRTKAKPHITKKTPQ